MKTATVFLNDGTNYQTNINGTKEEIEQYFLGKWFNYGVEKDSMKKCVAVYVED